jgi:hypothetical protein
LSKVNTKLSKEIVRLKQSGRSFSEIGEELGIATGTAKTHYYLTTGQPSFQRIPESPYVRYDEPPTVEGDALILPDCEIPFHHAEFMNRVIDLADAWKIRQVICAGDLLHMDSLSGWEPNWTSEKKSALTESDEAKLMDAILKLPKNRQGEILEILGEFGAIEGKDFSQEMGNARRTLQALNECFDSFVWVIGNHEGRLLRAINSPVNPGELLNLMRLKEGKWTIGPYYYALLKSGGKTFRVTHPKSAANSAARVLAIQFHQNILMGHSHKLFADFDPSGDFIAWQIGHCVDELKLAYHAQRDAGRDSHKLGAVIVRGGYPWLLHTNTDWASMQKMA